MERLTVKRSDGRWALANNDGAKPLKQMEKIPIAINRLAAYEDTNLTPADINDLRNELCLKCGKYKDAHLGACDGCRWRKEQE